MTNRKDVVLKIHQDFIRCMARGEVVEFTRNGKVHSITMTPEGAIVEVGREDQLFMTHLEFMTACHEFVKDLV